MQSCHVQTLQLPKRTKLLTVVSSMLWARPMIIYLESGIAIILLNLHSLMASSLAFQFLPYWLRCIIHGCVLAFSGQINYPHSLFLMIRAPMMCLSFDLLCLCIRSLVLGSLPCIIDFVFLLWGFFLGCICSCLVCLLIGLSFLQLCLQGYNFCLIIRQLAPY